jgi:hypothetical protein
MFGAESLDARHFLVIREDGRVSGSPPCRWREWAPRRCQSGGHGGCDWALAREPAADTRTRQGCRKSRQRAMVTSSGAGPAGEAVGDSHVLATTLTLPISLSSGFHHGSAKVSPGRFLQLGERIGGRQGLHDTPHGVPPKCSWRAVARPTQEYHSSRLSQPGLPDANVLLTITDTSCSTRLDARCVESGSSCACSMRRPGSAH